MIITMSCNEVKIIKISSERTLCEGVMPQKCLKVQYANNEQWLNFYDNIEGFQWEPGFEYVLEVKSENIPDPPADGSSIKLVMSKLISKNFVGYTFEHTGHYALLEMNGTPASTLFSEKIPDLYFDLPQNKFWGTVGCNEISGTFEALKNEATFKYTLSKKMCPDLEAETLFVSFLDKKLRTEKLDDLLIFWSDGQEVLVLKLMD